tara:strand:- start:1 stop:783 length:783 start_codon:yes stop_codon:yes gene_type:complete
MNTTMDQALFPVKECPVMYDLAGNGDLKEDTGFKLIVREDTNQVISCMSNEYQLVSNETVMNKSSKIIKENDGVLTDVKSFGNGARTQWVYNFPKIKVPIDKGDVVTPNIIIKNSYDGSCEVSVLGGAFRLICSNGLVVGYVTHRSSNRHSIHNPSLQNGRISKLVEETVDNIQLVFKEDFPKLIDTKLNSKDIVKLVTMFPEPYIEPLINYITSKDINNYWDLLNAATWTLTHNANRNKESTHKLEQEIYKSVKHMAKA